MITAKKLLEALSVNLPTTQHSEFLPLLSDLKKGKKLPQVLQVNKISYPEFLTMFEKTFKQDRISFTDIQELVKHVPEKALAIRVGERNFCNRIPNKYHNQFSVCQ